MNGGQQPDGVVFFARMFFNCQNFAFVQNSDASTAVCRVYHDELHRIQYRRTGRGGRKDWPLDGPKARSLTHLRGNFMSIPRYKLPQPSQFKRYILTCYKQTATLLTVP